MGTPRYMSPEQARGEKVDARTDIFSLGVMLYEMIAGRAPFAGATTNEMIAAILRDEPPPLAESRARNAGANWSASSARRCAKNAAERYQTAGDLLADLKNLSNGWSFRRNWARWVRHPAFGRKVRQPHRQETSRTVRVDPSGTSSRPRYAPLPPGSRAAANPC